MSNQPIISQETIDSQYARYQSSMESRVQEAQRVFNTYNNNINSQSQQATTKLSSFNSSVDAYTRDLNNYSHVYGI